MPLGRETMVKAKPRASHVGNLRSSPFLTRPKYIKDIVDEWKSIEGRMLVDPDATDEPEKTRRNNSRVTSIKAGDRIMQQFYGTWVVCQVKFMACYEGIDAMLDAHDWQSLMPRCCGRNEVRKEYMELYPGSTAHTKVVVWGLGVLEYKFPKQSQMLLCRNCNVPAQVERYDVQPQVAPCSCW